jgi:hypothetical protein
MLLRSLHEKGGSSTFKFVHMFNGIAFLYLYPGDAFLPFATFLLSYPRTTQQLESESP